MRVNVSALALMVPMAHLLDWLWEGLGGAPVVTRRHILHRDIDCAVTVTVTAHLSS